mmetsp:Transcript_157899/g.294538  ORF Transcript_157899/g.294538 Transcript_157899/m.294538 type:complete len:685 (+) Transcript_157899:106-2160(+)
MVFSGKHTLVWLLLCSASAPVSAQDGLTKVITLLKDLKTDVETEGKTEATNYNTFACWCKTTTATKSSSITTGEDDIESFSAEIESKSSTKAEKQQKKLEEKAKYEKLLGTLQDTVDSCTKSKAEYEASAADFDKALSSLDNAISKMKDGKNFQPTFLELADAMGMIPNRKQQVLSSLLQRTGKVDPANPDYKYHSDDIIKMLEDLQSDFLGKKATLDEEWTKTSKVCEDTKKNLKDELDNTKDEIEALTSQIATLSSEIATARSNLISEEDLMKENQLYLKDLTKECEDRAAEFDQRTRMRNAELQALIEALTYLEGDAKKYNDVNSFIQTSSKVQTVRSHSKAVNLLQMHRESRGLLSTQARQDKAIAIVQRAGQHLAAPMLSALAMKIAADPFLEVKKLIQDLIERLLAESTAEASKKGFCDTEVEKAKLERDNRFAEVKSLHTQLAKLEAKKDTLIDDNEQLTTELGDLAGALSDAIDNRNTTKTQNLDTIDRARKGLAAVEEALTILRTFYKKASRAKDVVLIQASPIEVDNPGAGFGTGAYKGKQAGSVAIIELVTQIKEDYEETIKMTEAAEKQSLADFVKFERTSLSDTSAKETKKELNAQDLNTTKVNIEESMTDLTTAQSLLDGALKTLEELKPTCMDSGMSYAERVAKREEEIAALKSALCILDPEKTEAECQ